MIKSFKDLRVWQESHKLALELYKITKQFPKDEQYGLTSQLRRAASSVPANIVEGYYRNTTKELIQFLYNSRGSIGEIIYFLLLVQDLRYISKKSSEELTKRYNDLLISINALIKSLRKK